MVQIQVSEGVLEGEVVHNDYGGSFCSFKGIPYAQPPLGDLRFKATKPPKAWQGVRSAKEFGPKCHQYDIFMKTIVNGSEDCLYLNVYTPEIKPSKPLPVMVWIHGGGFVCGSGDDDIYGPEFLVKHNVILVTFNYRLEVLGFLCLDTEEVPGNAGMKDQVQALRWVQKNISKFGGDPDNVTIFGESAGGASVNYHLLSPMSKGLFKRAIMQSGSAACEWTLAYKPRERAFALGRQLGLYTNDIEDLYTFLKNQPYESLINAQAPILLTEKGSEDMNIYFSIVDERQSGQQERFYYGDVVENLKHGIHDGIDVIAGYNSDEGVFNLGNIDNKLDLFNNYLQYFLPKSVEARLTLDQQLEIGQKIKNYYSKDKRITSDDWEQLVKFYYMSYFAYGIVRSAKLCAMRQKNNLYLYKFSCHTERNMSSQLLGTGSVVGNKAVTVHADDLMYLFNTRMSPIKVDPSSETFKIIDRFTTMWTNFAKSGNPTPDESLDVKWKPYCLEQENYLEIGNVLEAKTKPDYEEIQFWDSIYRQHAPHSE